MPYRSVLVELNINMMSLLESLLVYVRDNQYKKEYRSNLQRQSTYFLKMSVVVLLVVAVLIRSIAMRFLSLFTRCFDDTQYALVW
jgi:hypothetical protein